VKIKDGVNIWGLEKVMQRVLKEADEIWSDYGEELVITSARDGIHSAGSLHYYGLAVDLRTRYFSEQDKQRVFEELKDVLGWEYDVILHSTHIHVEHQKSLDDLNSKSGI
jgi:hypothetical protein